MYMYVLAITQARVPCGTSKACVVTDLLHEQLTKDDFKCCVPQRDTIDTSELGLATQPHCKKNRLLGSRLSPRSRPS